MLRSITTELGEHRFEFSYPVLLPPVCHLAYKGRPSNKSEALFNANTLGPLDCNSFQKRLYFQL